MKNDIEVRTEYSSETFIENEHFKSLLNEIKRDRIKIIVDDSDLDVDYSNDMDAGDFDENIVFNYEGAVTLNECNYMKEILEDHITKTEQFSDLTTIDDKVDFENLENIKSSRNDLYKNQDFPSDDISELNDVNQDVLTLNKDIYNVYYDREGIIKDENSPQYIKISEEVNSYDLDSENKLATFNNNKLITLENDEEININEERIQIPIMKNDNLSNINSSIDAIAFNNLGDNFLVNKTVIFDSDSSHINSTVDVMQHCNCDMNDSFVNKEEVIAKVCSYEISASKDLLICGDNINEKYELFNKIIYDVLETREECVIDDESAMDECIVNKHEKEECAVDKEIEREEGIFVNNDEIEEPGVIKENEECSGVHETEEFDVCNKFEREACDVDKENKEFVVFEENDKEECIVEKEVEREKCVVAGEVEIEEFITEKENEKEYVEKEEKSDIYKVIEKYTTEKEDEILRCIVEKTTENVAKEDEKEECTVEKQYQKECVKEKEYESEECIEDKKEECVMENEIESEECVVEDEKEKCAMSKDEREECVLEKEYEKERCVIQKEDEREECIDEKKDEKEEAHVIVEEEEIEKCATNKKIGSEEFDAEKRDIFNEYATEKEEEREESILNLVSDLLSNDINCTKIDTIKDEGVAVILTERKHSMVEQCGTKVYPETEGNEELSLYINVHDYDAKSYRIKDKKIVDFNKEREKDTEESITDMNEAINNYLNRNISKNFPNVIKDDNEEGMKVKNDKTVKSTDNIFDKIFLNDKNIIIDSNRQSESRHKKCKKRSHELIGIVIEPKKVKVHNEDNKSYTKSCNSFDSNKNNDILKSSASKSISSKNISDINMSKKEGKRKKSTEIKGDRGSSRYKSSSQSSIESNKKRRKSTKSKLSDSSDTLSLNDNQHYLLNDEVLDTNYKSDVNIKEISCNYGSTSKAVESTAKNKFFKTQEHRKKDIKNTSLVKSSLNPELPTKDRDYHHSKVKKHRNDLNLIKMDKQKRLYSDYESKKFKSNLKVTNTASLNRKSEVVTENGDTPEDIAPVKPDKQMTMSPKEDVDDKLMKVIENKMVNEEMKDVEEYSFEVLTPLIGKECNQSDTGDRDATSSKSKGSRTSKNKSEWWHTKRIFIEWNGEGRYKGVKQPVNGRLFDLEPIVGEVSLVRWSKPASQKKYPAIVIEIM